MPAADTASRITPYIEQLLEDESARESLRRGAGKLHDAYERSQKRRVKATRDKKLRGQLSSAARAIGEGASALASGAERPPKRRRRMPLKLMALVGIGAGVAVACSEDLRSSLFGSGSSPQQGVDGSGA